MLRWRWRSEERGETGLSRERFVEAFADWMAEHWTSHLVWLAEADEAPVGMAWLAVVHRVPGPERWMRLSGNLQSVYVIPERRGSGTGELLVHAVVDRAHLFGLDYISVHPSERSFSLYRRLGFEESSGVLELRMG
jgi:GNAT superfamily N-acetyltransferase